MHDILVECGQLSLDLIDGNRGNFVVNAEQGQIFSDSGQVIL